MEQRKKKKEQIFLTDGMIDDTVKFYKIEFNSKKFKHLLYFDEKNKNKFIKNFQINKYYIFHSKKINFAKKKKIKSSQKICANWIIKKS